MRLIKEAGYSKPTPLQLKIIPLILKGRDLAVESGEQTGKTASFLLPLMHKIKKGRPCIKILIIAGDIEHAKKTHRFFKIFSTKKLTKLSAAIIGEDSETRKEYKLLQKKPEIIIGTSKGVIDHIRRGNLSFEHLQAMVIDSPEEQFAEYFNQDLYFILSKINHKFQRIYFSPEPLVSGNINQIIKRPIIISKSDWIKDAEPPDHFYFQIEDINEKLKLVYNLILAKQINSLFIFCENSINISKIKEDFHKKGMKTGYIDNSLSDTERQKVFDNFQDKQINFLLINTNVDVHKINFTEVSFIINFDVLTNLQKQLKYIVSNTQDNIEIISFLQDTNFDFGKLQEIGKLNTKKGSAPTDEQVLTGLIQNMVKKIKEDENPEELKKLKKIIQKNVPFLYRSYFTAYLLKQSSFVKTGTKNNATTRLFINIGKNRRVFPKDLISLFCEKMNIHKNNIKEVKILDNYSFVEMDSIFARKAIDEMSGIEYKGRKIAVNFARKKDRKTPYRNRT